MRALLAGCASFLLTVGVAAAADFTPGSSGLGDPFFPNAGNGGYDVANYDLKLAYDPGTDVLDGKAVVTATATQDLSRFDLDLRGFQISKLTVNGVAAAFARDGQELVITPQTGIPSGSTFRVAVEYSGVPEVIVDPDQSIEGWIPTDDGAFVVNEPQGSPGWYPCNDNPRDKATFDFAVTVPEGLTALANGVLVSSTTSAGRTTWVWKETDPMATYLSTSTLGRFDLSISSTASGLPVYVAVDPQLSKGQVLSKLVESVEFYPPLRAVSVQRGRGDRRLREGRRLLARDADEAELPLRPERGDARARDLAHVVRRLGDADGVARHLAARGLRHLVGVDLERGAGEQERGAVVQAALQHARAGQRRSGIRRLRSRGRRRSCSTGRSTTAAG